MSTEDAGRPAPSAEGMLAALVFAVVSLLLAATLPWDRLGAPAGTSAGPSSSRAAGRP